VSSLSGDFELRADPGVFSTWWTNCATCLSVHPTSATWTPLRPTTRSPVNAGRVRIR